MINLSSMFAKSPFKPLRDHMDKVVESVAPLKDFFDALHQGNYSKVEEIQQQISKLLFIKFSNGLRSVAGLGKFQKHQLIVLLLLNTQNEKVCWDLLFLPACCSSPSFPGLKS